MQLAGQIKQKSKGVEDREQKIELIKNQLKARAERELLQLDEEDINYQETEEALTVDDLIDESPHQQESDPAAGRKKSKQGCCSCKRRKHAGEKQFKEMDEDEKKEKRGNDRMEFVEKLKMYKFYLAVNFYNDNVGSVEIVNQAGDVETTTF